MEKIKRLLQQDFIKHNLVFFIGTLGIAVGNYLYYPVMGRLTSVSDFGEIQALISLFMELGIVLTAFGYVITNIVHNYEETHQGSKNLLLLELERLALLICGVLVVVLAISSYYLKTSFQFSSFVPFLALGFLIVLNVPSTFRTYYLQGEKKLKEVALSGIIFAVGKLILSAVLIIIGWRVFGAMAGYIIAQALALYYLVLKTRHKLPPLRNSLPIRLEGFKFKTERNILKRELIYGGIVLLLLAGMTILYTSDAIIVRRYFSADESGIYSGVSAIARMVFFVTASVAGVLIATVKLGKAHATENRRILKRSLLLILLVGGAVAGFFSLFPEFSVRLLIGHAYAGDAELLPWLSLAMLLASFVNLLFSYQIALRRYNVLWPNLLGLALLPILTIANHATLEHIAYNYVICNGIVAVIALVQVLNEGSKHAKETAIGSTA
jgi:O-antigen/teichoic acid export membrane protein